MCPARPPTDAAPMPERAVTTGFEALEPPMHFGNDERAHNFALFLQKHRGERHVAALQDFPDPDAISSALAYRMLAARNDIEVEILYEGRISHQENLALVQILDLEVTRYTEGMPLGVYDGAVFIDNQGTTTRLMDRFEREDTPTLAVIDHHAPQGLLRPEFTDIRPVGAAATHFPRPLTKGEIRPPPAPAKAPAPL